MKSKNYFEDRKALQKISVSKWYNLVKLIQRMKRFKELWLEFCLIKISKKDFWPSCREMFELFIEKANPTTKEVTYDEFIAASYGE
jgi:hypothetical protein